jgi:hypothetical protein
LLLYFIEAIEVTLPRHAPWIFLRVNRLWDKEAARPDATAAMGKSLAIRIPVTSSSDLAFLD